MSDPVTRMERAMKRKKKKSRNPVAQELHENRGAFAMKVLNPKKGEYKRVKLDPKNLEEETDNDLDCDTRWPFNFDEE